MLNCVCFACFLNSLLNQNLPYLVRWIALLVNASSMFFVCINVVFYGAVHRFQIGNQ